MRKKSLFISLIISVVVGLSACNNSSNDNNNDSEVRNDRMQVIPLEDKGLEVTILEALPEHLGGISLGLIPEIERDLTFDFNDCPQTDERMHQCWGYFQLKTPQDILSFSITNGGIDEHHSFLLKLLYNYEEVAFKPLGSNEFMTELAFSLAFGYSAYIPFQLSDTLEISAYTSKLTVVFVAFPDYFRAVDRMQRIMEYPFGMILTFELDYGSNTPMQQLSNFENVNRVEMESPIFGLVLTSGLVESEIESAPMLIQASPGEMMTLGFSIDLTGYTSEKIENYLIIALLDWRQIEMNGLAYLSIAVEEEKTAYEMDYGRFTIIAPIEPGLYEFVLIGIPNSNHPNHFWSYAPAAHSERITIEVVD